VRLSFASRRMFRHEKQFDVSHPQGVRSRVLTAAQVTARERVGCSALTAKCRVWSARTMLSIQARCVICVLSFPLSTN
jgi:hypothetical protein